MKPTRTTNNANYSQKLKSKSEIPAVPRSVQPDSVLSVRRIFTRDFKHQLLFL